MNRTGLTSRTGRTTPDEAAPPRKCDDARAERILTFLLVLGALLWLARSVQALDAAMGR
jgi:hypothetical protein